MQTETFTILPYMWLVKYVCYSYFGTTLFGNVWQWYLGNIKVKKVRLSKMVLIPLWGVDPPVFLAEKPFLPFEHILEVF